MFNLNIFFFLIAHLGIGCFSVFNGNICQSLARGGEPSALLFFLLSESFDIRLNSPYYEYSF